jgi:type I restriction enzyme S subunit
MNSIIGWKTATIKELCYLGRGRVISGQEIDQNPGIYPVFSSQSKDNGKMGAIDTFDFDGEYVTWTTDGAYAGTIFHRIGKFNCTNVCGTLSAKEPQLDLKFLAYQLETVAKNHVSYVGNPKLMNGVMADIQLSLPAYKAEQSKIAEILSTLDRAIEQTEALIAKQQRIKTGLMLDLLTKGIDEHGNIRSEDTHAFKDSSLGLIPVEWEAKPLSFVADLKVGYAFKSSWFSENGIRLLRGENVGTGSPSWKDTEYLPLDIANKFEEYYLAADDLVIGMDRTFTKQGFKMSVIREVDLPCILVQRVGCFIPVSIPPKFMKLLIQSPIYQRELLLQQKGMDIPHLSKSEILAPLVPIPSEQDEMLEISNRVEAISLFIENSCDILSKLRHLKTGLMHDLLTGKRRVTPLLETETLETETNKPNV